MAKGIVTDNKRPPIYTLCVCNNCSDQDQNQVFLCALIKSNHGGLERSNCMKQSTNQREACARNKGHHVKSGRSMGLSPESDSSGVERWEVHLKVETKA